MTEAARRNYPAREVRIITANKSSLPKEYALELVVPRPAILNEHKAYGNEFLMDKQVGLIKLKTLNRVSSDD